MLISRWGPTAAIVIGYNPKVIAMRIEVFFFAGCPNHRPAVERVNEVLHEMGLPGDVVEVRITDPAMANSMGFLGSPTVRVNGLDIEPSARQRTTFGMMCRTYVGSGGVPSEDLIRSAITKAATARF